jgi:hypothetical protein
LIAATGGNIVRSSALDDVSPIRAAMELVPIDRILSAIRSKTDKKLYPGNESATSWSEERLLKEIADSYFRSIIQPRLVAAWAAAGKMPAPKAPSSRPAGEMPAVDIDRSHHDDPSAPPGPHSLSPPDAAPSASAVLQEAASLNVLPEHISSASEPPAATQAVPEPESAPETPPPQPAAPSNGNAGINPTTADVAPTRESVLAAFARNRVPPQPVAPQPRPAQPQPRPPERRTEPEPISDESWEELIAGFMAGMVNWNTRRLGPEPGQPGCRAPRNILRSFGL